MYLKVPDRKLPGEQLPHNTSVDEVRQALPVDVPGLTVDNNLNYPCVNFPVGTPPTVYQRVQKHLQRQGFAAY